ncbi:MAG TPA: penicillin-binding transpeptidase domain-containing protein, partial [Thermoanaerobaculia bacterium]|nr:penicillin-binding transpeptidase domain-containing protein [Thermoanaerobaculia bacterium]
SRRYFGCAPENLTVAQAAFLASLPQRPTAFNPLRDPKAAARRQARVLGRMRDLGMIDISAFNVARAERLRFSPAAGTTLAQHFVDVVLSRGESEGSQRSANSSRRAPPVPRRGLIRTTLDARLQTDILGIISAQKATLLEHGATSVAVAVLDNRTGEWLAWEGSGDYFGESFGGAIDGVTALRQPGSTLKPFTYALAFENGWSPASVLADVPQSFPTAKEGIVYVPRNYDGAYRGPLRVRAALAGSQNVPAVALASKLGVPALLRLLRGVGFRDLTKTADYYGLGLTLGDAEVTLEQLVTAYAIFARGGVAVHPRFLATTPPVAEPRVFSPTTAFWITDILADSRAREAVFGSGGSLDFPFPVAVKTGTSQAYHDNWTVGYTREVTVGVWVGNFDRRPLRNSTGITGAGPIFHAVMLAAAHRTGSGQGEIVPRPDGVERQPVCATSGLRPSLHCPDIESEWVAAGAPVRFCDWHRDGFVSWPAEFQSWAAAQRRASTPDESQRREPRLASSFLEIVNPPDGATYLVDPTLRGEFQALRLRASAGGVRWRVDGSAIEGEEWPLRPGRHTIVAVDRSGRSDAVTIVVR